MKTRMLAVAVFSLFPAACMSTGNESIRNENNATISSRLTKGATSKEQVRAAFGDPTSVNFTDSGNESWTYRHSISTLKPESFIPVVNYFSQGANVREKTLVILFDRRGIVQNYTLSDAKQETRWGLGAL